MPSPLWSGLAGCISQVAWPQAGGDHSRAVRAAPTSTRSDSLAVKSRPTHLHRPIPPSCCLHKPEPPALPPPRPQAVSVGVSHRMHAFDWLHCAPPCGVTSLVGQVLGELRAMQRLAAGLFPTEPTKPMLPTGPFPPITPLEQQLAQKLAASSAGGGTASIHKDLQRMFARKVSFETAGFVGTGGKAGAESSLGAMVAHVAKLTLKTLVEEARDSPPSPPRAHHPPTTGARCFSSQHSSCASLVVPPLTVVALCQGPLSPRPRRPSRRPSHPHRRRAPVSPLGAAPFPSSRSRFAAPRFRATGSNRCRWTWPCCGGCCRRPPTTRSRSSPSSTKPSSRVRCMRRARARADRTPHWRRRCRSRPSPSPFPARRCGVRPGPA